MLSKACLFADRDWPAEVEERSVSLTVNSSGSNIFGQILLPALAHRDALSPVVLMLHGYPGTEKNSDIACALRRAGLAVIQFSYRGVWGSHGEYRFSHLTEDTVAVLDYLENRAEEYHLDMDRFLHIFQNVLLFFLLSLNLSPKAMHKHIRFESPMETFS